MAIQKITGDVIATSAVTADSLADTTITAAKLHTTLDLTGKTVTVATASAGDNDTTVASTAFVSTAVANLADSAPSTLDTLNELAAALGDDANFSTTVTTSIATKLPLAGGTLTGNLNFGDSDKAVFGNGSDLEIYHDGSNSYIKEKGNGVLNISGGNAINFFTGNAADETGLTIATDGAVTLYHNNSPKLATTSTGIDVTGTATMDGLTVDGTSDLNGSVTIGTSLTTLLSGNDIDFQRAGDSYLSQTGGGSLFIRTNDGTSNKVRLNVSPIGDISFYEDTGATAKFFWDASAESLGIGNNNPAARLTIDNSIATTYSTTGYAATPANSMLYLNNTNGGSNTASLINFRAGSGDGVIGFVEGGGTNDADFVIQTDGGSNGVERFRISNSGIVHIGPGTAINDTNVKLQLNAPSGGEASLGINDDGAYALLLQYASGNYARIRNIKNTPMLFETNNTERMRIDSSGKVGIGVTPKDDWNTGYDAIQIGESSAFFANGSADEIFMSQNARYASGSWKYNSSGTATLFDMQSGSTRWRRAASGSEDGTISWSDSMFIDTAGKVGVGTTSPTVDLDVSGPSSSMVLPGTSGTTPKGFLRLGYNDRNWGGTEILMGVINDGNTGYASYLQAKAPTNYSVNRTFIINPQGGNLLVGTTSTTVGAGGSGVEGFRVDSDNGIVQAAASGNPSAILNRTTSDGSIVSFRKNGSEVGSIGTINGSLYIASPVSSDSGLRFSGSTVHPCDTSGNPRDNAINFGYASGRLASIYASNGVIQTSDRNEKQDIEALTDVENRVAVATKGLLRKFRWQSAVEEKGDEARIHFGIIAQDLQDAFTAEGLDAGDYAMFISDTWTDDDGVEQTRLGVRYSELLAFIIAAI